jgi:putative aldouronate transport system permease protein
MASLENVSCAKIKLKKKKAPSDIVFDVIVYTVLVIFALVTLYPVINTIAYSFSDGTDSIYGRIHLFPRVWSTKSYEEVLFNRASIRTGAIVTIARTLIGTAAGVAANAFLAYILSRKRFIFGSALSLFWIITIYAQAGLVPVLCLYRRLHLTQSFWVYIVPGIISGLYVIVMRTYMKGIPDSLEEAARLDGAGYIRIFWSIITPICKPVYAAIALFIATAQWNSWFDARIYNKFMPQYTTLQYEMMKYFSYVVHIGRTLPTIHQSEQLPVSPRTLRSALAVVSMLPLMILYPFLQKYFVSGLTVRGIKD